MKLPRELRDMVWAWAYAFADSSPPRTRRRPKPEKRCWGVRQAVHGRVRYGPPGEGTNGWLAEGPDTRTIICSRQPHPIATVCKEAYEAFLRYHPEPGHQHKVWELGRSVPVVTTIYRKRTDSLARILPPKNMPLVLNLGDDPDNPNDLWSPRVLDLVLEAQDGQIKLLLPGIKYFCLPFRPDERTLPDAAKVWLKTHGDFRRPPLVSVNDAATWKELSSIARDYDLSWPFANMLLKKMGPRSVVKTAIKPLERIWKYENRIRLKENEEGLKPLPRIDVVVYVSMGHDSTTWKHGNRWVDHNINIAYNDLVKWGVYGIDNI